MSAVPPGHTVVLFDGTCKLCNGLVRFILRRDRRDAFRFCQLQHARALLEGYGDAGGDRDSVIVLSGGRVQTESDAVCTILERLGGAWRVVSWLRIVPRGLRDGVYRFVARRRSRWFGRLERCPLPDEHTAHKFL